MISIIDQDAIDRDAKWLHGGSNQIFYRCKPMVRDIGESITLLYPNGTSVTIRGDEHIVKQLIDRLDGHFIDYIEKKNRK